jgi:hypothetical protein
MEPTPDPGYPAEASGVDKFSAGLRNQKQRELIIEPTLRDNGRKNQQLRIAFSVTKQGKGKQSAWKNKNWVKVLISR